MTILSSNMHSSCHSKCNPCNILMNVHIYSVQSSFFSYNENEWILGLSSSKNDRKQYICILKLDHMFHHCQALANSHLCNELNETLKTVECQPVRWTNKSFRSWREDEAHQTLLHIEERWLSRGQVLACFIVLKEKIKEFLRLINQKMLDEMTNEFLFRTSFLSDIFSLYETNKCMQSADANKLECKEIVDAFVRKVEIRNWWNRM